MTHLRVAACQIDTVVGDLDGNAARIVAGLREAERRGADLAVFPELAVTGYPPEDLLGRAAFVTDNLRAVERVLSATTGCAVVFGFVDRDGEGRLYNAAAVGAGGVEVGRFHKRLLPNYGVFDERRWFTPGAGGEPLPSVAGVTIGVSVCEDVWFPGGPLADQATAGAGVLVNLNASPYSRGRRVERLDMLRERVAEVGRPIVYVNQVGGQDELVFDGASLVVGADGSLVASAPQFEEAVMVVDVPVGGPAGPGVSGGGARPRGECAREHGGRPPGPVAPVLDAVEEVYAALVLGTRDYLTKNRFTDAVVGLSGGIDSSLVAAVAVDAIGAGHVHGVAMPSRYSSPGSVSDARALAGRIGIDLLEVPIDAAHQTLAGLLSPALGAVPSGLTDENLQSRVRGVILMALSNARGWIVLTTGNKSEMATGYSTLYGDSAGGFAVIKDVPKLLVYELCRLRNRRGDGEVIPESVLTKPPSAELRPDQRDDESLPPYEVLDPVLAAYVEGDGTAEDLIRAGHDPTTVTTVIGLVDRAEYKRRQMPPGVRITTKAFGRDRRMPITNLYRDAGTGPGSGSDA
ncbi:MAG: NAD+ synthase [Acidimicrobiales bacterium]